MSFLFAVLHYVLSVFTHVISFVLLCLFVSNIFPLPCSQNFYISQVKIMHDLYTKVVIRKQYLTAQKVKKVYYSILEN